jgi:hypothetical protein
MVPAILFGIGSQIPLGSHLDRFFWTVAQAGKAAMAPDYLLPYRPAIEHVHLLGQTDTLAYATPGALLIIIELERGLHHLAQANEVGANRIEDRHERFEEWR